MSRGKINCEWLGGHSDFRSVLKWWGWTTLWVLYDGQRIGIRFHPPLKRLVIFGVATILGGISMTRLFSFSRPVERLILIISKPSGSYSERSFSFYSMIHTTSPKESDTNSVLHLVPGLLWWNPRTDNLEDGLVLTRETLTWMWTTKTKTFWLFLRIWQCWQKWVRGSLRMRGKTWHLKVFFFRDESPTF